LDTARFPRYVQPMMKPLAMLVGAISIILALPNEAQSCPKGGKECPQECMKKTDPHDAEAARRGEPAKITGKVSCASCQGKAKGPCAPKLRDANGNTYALTRNATLRDIHQTALDGSVVEVSGKLLRDNGTAFLSPTSFRVVKAGAVTESKSDKAKKPASSCQH